jgi:hypothetical protein
LPIALSIASGVAGERSSTGWRAMPGGIFRGSGFGFLSDFDLRL